jgi:hypothetical protein
METVKRVDFYEYDPSTTFKMNDDGTYSGTAIVTNIGIFKYYNDDGTERYEWRPPEEVFSPDTVESLKNVPVTNDHPVELISHSGRKDLAVGITGNEVKTTPYHLAVDVVINDAKAIRLIKSGKTGLSLGYTAEIEITAGNELGVNYDAIQRNIRIDHLAVVRKGRAGDRAKIKTDSITIRLTDVEQKENEAMADNFKTIKIDGMDFQAEPDVIKAYNANLTKIDTLEKDITGKQTENAKLMAERDSAKEKLDSVSKELEDLKKNHVDADKVAEMVKFRVGLEGIAAKVEVEVKDGQSDMEIMKSIILKQRPHAKLDGQPDEYIRHRFDGVIEDLAIDLQKKEDAEVRAPGVQKSDESAQSLSYTQKMIRNMQANNIKAKKE